MLIGVPKEIKNHEYRVGLTPSSVHELTRLGHQVIVETQAGSSIAFSDEAYVQAGAEIISNAAEIFDRSEMIIKVKEPQEKEWQMLRPGQILFTFLHLAADQAQAMGLMNSGCAAIAYETVTDAHNGLPLLAPMSEVAGRMSVQAGAHFLQKEHGGTGILLGGVPGVPPARVVIIGGGMVGTNAARMAVGMGADVTILDKSSKRLHELDNMFQGRVKTLYSHYTHLEEAVLDADLVIGGVLVTGAAAPKLVSEDMIRKMRPGSVVVDVAIDQGGCFATSRPTTHADPIYHLHGVIHYCVTNMPGAVARTSTMALNNATLPYILAIAQKGLHHALQVDEHLQRGLNVYKGAITHAAVAEALGLPYVPLSFQEEFMAR